MKKLPAIVLSLALASALSTSAFAAEPVQMNNVSADVSSMITTQAEKSPRIKWTGTAQLNPDVYSNITASNNIFPDSPLITSSSKNPGIVTVRVINSKGNQVGGTKTMRPGESARLDRIPANSGTYTIQGYAEVAGEYTFSVD